MKKEPPIWEEKNVHETTTKGSIVKVIVDDSLKGDEKIIYSRGKWEKVLVDFFSVILYIQNAPSGSNMNALMQLEIIWHRGLKQHQ